MRTEVTNLYVPDRRIEQFCRKNQIRKLSLFGSVLRDSFRPDSDIDVLDEFKSGRGIGYLGMARMEVELAGIFGRRVDLHTPAELSKYSREEVINCSLVQYES